MLAARFRDMSNIAGKVRLHPSKWMSLTRYAPPSVDLRSSFPPGYQPCSAFGNKFKQVTSLSIQVRLVLHRQDSPSFLFRKQRWRHCIARVLEADNFHPTQVLLLITRKETIQSSLEIPLSTTSYILRPLTYIPFGLLMQNRNIRTFQI